MAQLTYILLFYVISFTKKYIVFIFYYFYEYYVFYYEIDLYINTTYIALSDDENILYYINFVL